MKSIIIISIFQNITQHQDFYVSAHFAQFILGSFEEKKKWRSPKKNKKIIIGGGETASIFNKDKANSDIFSDIYISTGGGVLLEYIEKGTSLVGLKAFTK